MNAPEKRTGPGVITLLTDFGVKDHYVGAMKGVVLGICPEAQLIDISHEIEPYAITEAAFTLSQAWKYYPDGTVHVVVVDPGVGSSRRPLIVQAAGHYFVAPDNGVLTMVYDAVPDHEVREITAERFFRQPVSRTFHGRDIFAPVAAHLANGVSPAEFGRRIEDYLRLGFGAPMQTGSNVWTGTVLKVDRFGNVVTNFESGAWERLTTQPFEMRVGEQIITGMAPNYAAMAGGSLFAIAGSAGFLEVSVNRGNAANLAKARPGDAIVLKLS